MSAAPRLQSASPFVHAAAVSAAAVLTSLPSRRAAPASIHGSNCDGASLSKSSSRLARSPLGSIAITGTPCREQLLQQHDREAGLSGPGHPDDHPVGQQVVGIELEG